MHPNLSFRNATQTQNLNFARERGFGVLAVNGPAGPIMAHVPFWLAEDGSHADLHLARSNPLIGAAGPAVLAVSGPDGYISPDWYGMADQVPTWNYIAVHLRGVLVRLDADALEPHLHAVSDRFEARLLPKPVWTPSKMSEGVMDRMMRMIVPLRLQIETVDGTWKLNQNKEPAAREGAIRALSAQGGASEDLARAMRELG